MGNIIGIVLNLVTGFFKGGATNGAKATGIGNGILFYGAIASGAYWMLSGKGQEWSITLNALELSGVALAGSALMEYLRRVPPPQV